MYLGLDLGTTNIKALLLDAEGRTHGSRRQAVSLHKGGGHHVEQDLEEIWQATLTVLRRLGEETNLHQVRAVGVSSQGGALQALDSTGRPVGPVYSWLDQRAAAVRNVATEAQGEDWFALRTGVNRCPFCVGLVRYLRDQGHCAPWKIGFVGDQIVGRLCGRPAHEATSLAIAGLCRPDTGRSDGELLAWLDLSEAELPPLLKARDVAGGILDDVAGATGLPVGIPVAPAMHDQYAAAIGAGVLHSGEVMVGTGTAWVLLAMEDADRAKAGIGLLAPAPVPGLRGRILSLVNGGSALTWLLDLMGVEDRSSAALDALIGEAPPGCDGMLFLPHLAPHAPLGLSTGGRGQWLHLRLDHGRGHAVRAVVEGLAFELRRYLELLGEQGSGQLVLCGGAAASERTVHILADVGGRPVQAMPQAAMSARGAAVVARALIEPDTPLAELAFAMLPEAHTVAPDALTQTYAERYAAYCRAAAAPVS